MIVHIIDPNFKVTLELLKNPNSLLLTYTCHSILNKYRGNGRVKPVLYHQAFEFTSIHCQEIGAVRGKTIDGKYDFIALKLFLPGTYDDQPQTKTKVYPLKSDVADWLLSTFTRLDMSNLKLIKIL